jgi:hypothetical protein
MRRGIVDLFFLSYFRYLNAGAGKGISHCPEVRVRVDVSRDPEARDT